MRDTYFQPIAAPRLPKHTGHIVRAARVTNFEGQIHPKPKEGDGAVLGLAAALIGLRKHARGKMAQAARLWLQWQLKGDQEAAKAFVGPDCTLCKDPEWVVKKKNMK